MRTTKFPARLALNLLGLSSFLLLGYYVLTLPMPLGLAPDPNIGGAFELVDQDGKRVTRDNLVGKPLVLLFGSTRCADMCETRLAQISSIIEEVGSAGSERLQVVFVGLDPERDNPGTLKAFLAPFGRRFVGLSGTESQIRKMTMAYRAHYRKSPDGLGGYRIRHPTSAFLFDSKGELTEVSDISEWRSTLSTKLTALAEN